MTSIWGIPRRAGAIPSRLNIPTILLSFAIGRSPWSTEIVTEGWLSIAVVNICERLQGIVVLASTIGVSTPPSVSIPSVKGVTSSRRISLAPSPPTMIFACIAAPRATASSGFTDLFNSTLNSLVRASWIAFERDWPPTRRIQFKSFALILASLRDSWPYFITSSTRCDVSCSILALVRDLIKCRGVFSVLTVM